MNKRGIELDVLAWWIIAIAVLVLLIAGYVVLRGKGINLGEFVKNLIRFGR